MELYHAFLTASRAEKNAGTAFLGVALVLLASSAYSFTAAGQQSPLAGVRYPALIAGLGILVGGWFYGRQLDQHVRTQTQLYQHNPAAFAQAELARATTLHAGYQRYTWVYAGLALVGAGLWYCFTRSVWGGIGYVLLLFSLFTVGSEQYSRRQAATYLAVLRAWTNSRRQP